MSNKPKSITPEEHAQLLQKILTEQGRWELVHPGACYVCSSPGVTTYHDYDKGCPRRGQEY